MAIRSTAAKKTSYMSDKLERTDAGKVRPVGFNVFKSFKCAIAGICATAKERNFKIELCFGVAAVALGALFSVSFEQWLVIVVCIGLVLGFECLNTAIEAVVDLASPEWHEQARIAKDAAAGATLLVSVASLIVGVALFAPRILAAVGLL